MMAKAEFGSPATVHSRLKSMREKGWLMLSDTDDTRRKQVELNQSFQALSQAEAAAAGLWTLQASVFPENRASLALHRSAGYRTLAVRSRIGRLDGRWRDTVLLERRSDLA